MGEGFASCTDKPLLFKLHGTWWCGSGIDRRSKYLMQDFVLAYGKTPQQAYQNWAIRPVQKPLALKQNLWQDRPA